MATLSFGVVPAAALGLILWAGNLGAQALTESRSTVINLTDMKPDARRALTWRMSAAALATANTMDIASSWGKCEQNSVLAGPDGKFGGKGAFLKTGIVGGVLAVEWLMTRKTKRARKVLSILNFGTATGIGALAVRNYGIPAPAGTERCR